MALRNVVFSNEELIRKKSRPVTEFDDKLFELLDDMYETMKKEDGVGIAAPQVGVLRQIVVIETNGMKLELINPKITKSSGSQESFEGCLSVKEYNGIVIRPYKVTIDAQDRFGSPFSMTVEGFMSTVFCHEIDHLSGILFTDKAIELFRKDDRKALDRFKKRMKESFEKFD